MSRPLPLARVGVVAALAAWLVLSLRPVRTVPFPPPPPSPPVAPAWVVDIRDTPEGRALMGKELVVPSAPLSGQVKPPCPDGYVALGGGCWVKTDRTAPCPVTMWRSGQGCYLPMMKAAANTSMGR